MNQNILQIPVDCPVSREGIFETLPSETLSGNNKKYQGLYDRLAPFYDFATKLYAFFHGGGDARRVHQYLAELDVKDGDEVLEVSIGTGRNIVYLNPKASYWGVDVSLRMMEECAKKLHKRKRGVTLLQAEAESLPLKTASFDVVYSVGGFNFFSDRAKAVAEMVRVAKPGTKLMIVDETERLRKAHEKKKASGAFYQGKPISDPRDFLTPECEKIAYREILQGDLYILTFWKKG